MQVSLIWCEGGWRYEFIRASIIFLLNYIQHSLGKNYIAVYFGRGIEHAVFICKGVGRCYWEQHIRPFVQGASKAELNGKEVSFRGFHELGHAMAFAGDPEHEVKLLDREEANKLKAEIFG